MPPEPAKVALGKLGDMYNFCSGGICRHKAIVSYFGQEFAKGNCEACDICLGKVKLLDDPLITAQKIISCVLRLKEKFGAGYVGSILVGSEDKRIKEARHDQLSTYGILSAERKQNVRNWIEQLIDQGYLQRTGEFNTISVTETGWNVIKGQETPKLLKPAEETAKKSKIDINSWEGVDTELFNVLRILRREKADEQGVPAFIVFGDAALRDMARRKPMNTEEFLEVRGVGQAKCDAYSEDFISAIVDYCSKSGIGADLTSDTSEKTQRSRLSSKKSYR